MLKYLGLYDQLLEARLSPFRLHSSNVGVPGRSGLAEQYGEVGTRGIMCANFALQVSEFNGALDQYAPPSGNN